MKMRMRPNKNDSDAPMRKNRLVTTAGSSARSPAPSVSSIGTRATGNVSRSASTHQPRSTAHAKNVAR